MERMTEITSITKLHVECLMCRQVVEGGGEIKGAWTGDLLILAQYYLILYCSISILLSSCTLLSYSDTRLILTQIITVYSVNTYWIRSYFALMVS